jgi:NADPH-dependent 2,4-dienoyl-CoA reductase/sulfur reductase-like enzyme
VGIGSVPNDELAREAGLEVGNGILVNAFCQTSDPAILAVGDVALHANPTFGNQWRLESWKNAEDQARVAAAFICGSPQPYDEVPWFWTDQYDLNLQIAGVPGDGLPALERGTLGTRGYLAYFLSGGRLRGAFGIGCGRDIRVARELIKAGGAIDLAELAAKGFVARAAPAFAPEGTLS